MVDPHVDLFPQIPFPIIELSLTLEQRWAELARQIHAKTKDANQ